MHGSMLVILAIFARVKALYSKEEAGVRKRVDGEIEGKGEK